MPHCGSNQGSALSVEQHGLFATAAAELPAHLWVAAQRPGVCVQQAVRQPRQQRRVPRVAAVPPDVLQQRQQLAGVAAAQRRGQPAPRRQLLSYRRYHLRSQRVMCWSLQEQLIYQPQ